MRRLLICSEKDISSVNIAAALTAGGDWEDRGSDGHARYQVRGDDVLMTIPELHIWADGLDKRFSGGNGDISLGARSGQRHAGANCAPYR